MEVSEELDLESLMGLLDEDFEPNEMEVTNQYLPKKLDRADNEVDESFTDHSLKKTEQKILKDIPLDFMEVTNQYLSEELDRVDNKVDESATDYSLKKAEPKILKDIPLDFIQPEVPKSSEKISLSASFKSSLIHTGEADSSDDENKMDLTDTGKDIKKKISGKINQHFDKNHRVIKTWKDKSESKLPMNKASADTSSIDKYTGIRIIKPLVPFDVLQQKMQGRRMIKMSFIKNCIRGGDIEGDWVTMGVIVQKVPPKTAKNGKTFSIWKMTDLLDCEKIVSVFLFGAAHAEHWKSAVGTVVGILNPSIMPGRDTNEVLSLSVDHAGKFMIMGTSRDFGHCKARRKDGETCRVIVNLAQCEYCVYHVKKEFKKFSSNRSELQTSYSGREPSFKNKILKGQNFFYGGQMFTAPAKQSSKSSSKDKLTLSSLPLKQKAESVENEERVKGIKKLEDMYGPEVVKTLETKSEFINEQLAVPSAGSRNLLQHLVGEKMRKEGKVQTITPKELLKMHERQMKEKLPTKGKSDSSILKNLIPQLGKGLTPGQNVMFDISTHKASKIISQQELTKLRAIEKIKNKGPLKRKDPNSVKPSSEGFKKVKAVLDKSLEEENESRRELEKGMLLKDSKLGNTDLNSERIKDILNRKSSHAHEVEMAETEREEIYFDKLEKKEQMLEKMASTREIVCDVVSCKQCKYTAESAADRCKVENHPLKCHKAIKRFFICLNCRRHRHCFTKYPQRPCRYCHGQKFERTGMIKPQSGPLLDTEKLLIRGEEIKFINK